MEINFAGGLFVSIHGSPNEPVLEPVFGAEYIPESYLKLDRNAMTKTIHC